MTGWMKQSGYARHARKCPRGKRHVRCVFKAQGPEVAPLSAATGVSTLGVKAFPAVLSWLHIESPSEQDGVKSLQYRKNRILLWEIKWH